MPGSAPRCARERPSCSVAVVERRPLGEGSPRAGRSPRDGSGRGLALARAALAGNPSDGYGGAVLAFTLPSFSARAEALPASAPGARPRSTLVEATIIRFAREFCADALCSAVRWTTTIPRGVGLGGSSAIVIATTRALCARHRVTLVPARLAEFALAVEAEELEIAAGMQDRVAQAYEGLTFMEFGEAPRYERLGGWVLPPIALAWRANSAQDSGPVHAELRARFERADPVVRAAIDALAQAARSARAALHQSDLDRFARCVDASFDARAQIMSLDPRHVSMIDLARSAGAAANYTGSGGAIVAVCRDKRQRRAVSAALLESGCEVLAIDRSAVSQYPQP